MRCNVGINPLYLSDQHLIAESVELTMIVGYLKRVNFEPRSEVPSNFVLGKGHIVFFSDKLLYIKNRLEIINREMVRRTFKPNTYINLDEIPAHLHNDWKPSAKDTVLVRARIEEKINAKETPMFWRYVGCYLDTNVLIDRMKSSPLHYV